MFFWRSGYRMFETVRVPRAELFHASDETHRLVVVDVGLGRRRALHLPYVPTKREVKRQVVPVQFADRFDALLGFRERDQNAVQVAFM